MSHASVLGPQPQDSAEAREESRVGRCLEAIGPQLSLSGLQPVAASPCHPAQLKCPSSRKPSLTTPVLLPASQVPLREGQKPGCPGLQLYLCVLLPFGPSPSAQGAARAWHEHLTGKRSLND